MAKPLEELRKIRLEKLEKAKKLGINPYPSYSGKRDLVSGALKAMGKDVLVAGRVMSIRGHGGIQFWDLVDESGKIQLVIKREEESKSAAQVAELIDVGDFISAKGEVFKTNAGETSVLVTGLQLLSKSLRPLPSQWYGLKDIEDRYRQRYVDLIMNPESRRIFLLRTMILSGVRKFLDSRGFVEVETPVLQPMYGGASARPFVTHHNALGCDLFLRISDELYLKRLIVGGFEKVYEVSKDFRNEGIDRAHNPEFTMVEFYWAYADYEDLMKLTEEMLSEVIKSAIGSTKIKSGDQALDFTPPIPRAYFADLLLKETGIEINKHANEKSLLGELKEKKIRIDLRGAVGIGAIYDRLYKEKIRPKIIQPTFLLDYPASMIALAKRKEDDPGKIASFQLLANGSEIIKAYNELNDPIDQKNRWLETESLVKEGDDEAERLDDDYVRALEYGMPPTAGWGMGIDRLVSTIVGLPLKEVILFPTLKPEK